MRRVIVWFFDNGDKVILGALFISSGLKALDKLVERYGERHPASRFWPLLDKMLDGADAVLGWIGDTFQAIVFTRKRL